MVEEIGFENGRNSNFQGLVTLTLTLDPAIQHTVVHHSSTSTDIPNFIEIEDTFCGRTDGRTFFPLSNIIRSTFGSRPKNGKCNMYCPNGRHRGHYCSFNIIFTHSQNVRLVKLFIVTPYKINPSSQLFMQLPVSY